MFWRKKKTCRWSVSGGYFFHFFFPRKTMKQTKRQNLFVECPPASQCFV